MTAGLLHETARTISALYPELAGEPLFSRASEEALPSHAADCRTVMKTKAAKCIDCALHIGRRNSVYGDGAFNAAVVFIGDIPSMADDLSGKIFSDESGDLLARMIAAMKLGENSVYKSNLVKCRPPQDRPASEKEVSACLPYLNSELESSESCIIVALGESAARFFSRSDAPIEQLRGKWHEYNGRRVMVTHHPRVLRKSPSKKKDTWNDLQLVMKDLQQ